MLRLISMILISHVNVKTPFHLRLRYCRKITLAIYEGRRGGGGKSPSWGGGNAPLPPSGYGPVNNDTYRIIGIGINSSSILFV